MNIEKKYFGTTGGRDVDLYTMTVDSGMSVSIITFGGAIQKLLVPDRNGKLTDVIGGYDDLIDYVEGDGYCIAEWSENVEEDLPHDAITVTITRTEGGPDERVIEIDGV